MFRLKDKIAIITGAASGQGRSASILFAKEGAKVACADINVKGCEETVGTIAKSGGDAICLETDVSKEDQVVFMIEETARRYGGLDILYNNAGVASKNVKINELPTIDFDRVLNINFKGAYYGCKYGIPEIVKRGRGGSVINTASIWGLFGAIGGGNVEYTSSKAAVIGLTKELANEWGRNNVRVNCICPGYIDTPMSSGYFSEEEAREHLKRIPLGRIARPEEVAYLALFLASDESSYCTGSVFVIDGGETAH